MVGDCRTRIRNQEPKSLFQVLIIQIHKVCLTLLQILTHRVMRTLTAQHSRMRARVKVKIQTQKDQLKVAREAVKKKIQNRSVRATQMTATRAVVKQVTVKHQTLKNQVKFHLKSPNNIHNLIFVTTREIKGLTRSTSTRIRVLNQTLPR